MRRLREWKAMQKASTTPTSNNNYRNRFTKLLTYAQAHKPATVVKTLITNITNNSFHYTVYYEKNNSKWTTDLLVATSRFSDSWAVQFARDGEVLINKSGNGYEELLLALNFFIDVPAIGSSEYKNLLVESAALIDEFKEYETLWD